MDDKTALHTAARRYCEDRYSDWAGAYNQLEARENLIENKLKPGWDYSEEEYGIFPRYRIDKAIRIEVERLALELTNSLEELRSQLICACDIAEARLRSELNNTIAREALREEAEDYKAYIQVLSERDLASIVPLPFRRVISAEESKKLWNELKTAWDIGDGYWFPLREDPTPPNVLAFHVDYFKAINGFAAYAMPSVGVASHGSLNFMNLVRTNLTMRSNSRFLRPDIAAVERSIVWL
jgi:hypothetical protein